MAARIFFYQIRQMAKTELMENSFDDFVSIDTSVVIIATLAHLFCGSF